MDDNYRKSPAREVNPTKKANDYYDAEEAHVPRRYEQAPSKCFGHRQGDTSSDHEQYDLAGEKTSDGSVTDIDTNDNEHGDVRVAHHCDPLAKKYESSAREYSPCAYGKCATSHRANKSEKLEIDDAENSDSVALCQSSAPANHHHQRHFENYDNPVTLPQALIAMRKLERLKDLQRRRDLSERYYSQEIRRLIGDRFFAENAAFVPAPLKNRERVGTLGTRANDDAQLNGPDQRNRGGGYTKELEPYGTMTTITRFNCGCFEESTIPLFSTSLGQVKKCESHRYQERPTSKLSPPYSQELSYRTAENVGNLENLNACQAIRTRGNKNSADFGAYRNSSKATSRDLESWEDRKVLPRCRRSPRNLSPVRANSPLRKKCSDSSLN